MRKATRKLSGQQMERFFRRYYERELGAGSTGVEPLTRSSVATFSSVRIRRGSLIDARGRVVGVRPAPAQRPAQTPEPAPAVAGSASGSGSAAAAAFDPYVFGLVPVMQREGREGLLARLAGIADVGQLRQMARAQQIAIGAELRTGDVDPDALRAAIADAVARRIADRRAAASETGTGG